MDDRPIGMFDSGFGGLTVARALIDLLPSEDLVYVGDTARYPYGSRSLDEVRLFASQITRKLVEDHDVKLVVVACNNATAAALEHLRYEFDVPLVGVIDPGLRALLSVTRTGRVGVIGTAGTIASGAYQGALKRRSVAASGPPIELTCAACPGFVELVERGETGGDEPRALAERLLAPVVEAEVDSLLLGCTHYPYLARTIGEVMGPQVVLVSSAEETAFEVREILSETGLGRRPIGSNGGRNGASNGASTDTSTSSSTGSHRWISSGEAGAFVRAGQHLFGPELDEADHWEPPVAAGPADRVPQDRVPQDRVPQDRVPQDRVPEEKRPEVFRPWDKHPEEMLNR
jgi:glutamate racemase